MVIPAVSLVLALTLPVPQADGGSRPARTTVFASGTDGYHTFRIPSVIRADNGDLLAFAEGRRNGRGDSGDIDLVMRRSEDGGATWSKLRVLWADGDNVCGNPCPVVDHKTGAIVMLATHNLGRDHESQIIAGKSQGSRTVWLLRSDDHGRTWTQPTEITGSTKLPNWTWYATGPGAGIQLERGEHKGRLVVPCDHIEAQTRHYYSHVVYSDDGGATWQLGGSSPQHQVNECEVVERGDGSLLLNMRNYDRAQQRRQVCVSADGGATFAGQRHDEALVEPICQASLRRVSWPEGDAPGLIAFSNPAHAGRRENLTLRVSRNDGETWPWSKVLHPGGSAYSCLVALPPAAGAPRVGCLFEADGYRTIDFVIVDLSEAYGRR